MQIVPCFWPVLTGIGLAVKEAVPPIAAAVVAYVAIKGLSTWRRQLRANAEYLLAKNLLAAFYELREAVANLRNPFMFIHVEQEAAGETHDDLPPKSAGFRARVQGFQDRWELVARAMGKLAPHLFEARAVWGGDIPGKADAIGALIWKLRLAVSDHIASLNPEEPDKPGEQRISEVNQVIYARADPAKDAFKNQLDQLLGSIEKDLKPYIAFRRK